MSTARARGELGRIGGRSRAEGLTAAERARRLGDDEPASAVKAQADT
jgi:hypothetical protein